MRPGRLALSRGERKCAHDRRKLSRAVPIAVFPRQPEPDDDEVARGHDGHDLIVMAAGGYLALTGDEASFVGVRA